MVQHSALHGERHIVSKSVKEFPAVSAGNQKENLQKASRWWKARQSTLALNVSRRRLATMTLTSTRRNHRVELKALSGRGRKRHAWVTAIYEDLRLDFERLRAAGVKFSCRVLLQHARKMIADAATGSPYHRNVQQEGNEISSRISTRWVQNFMKTQQIVLRSQYGRLMVSPAKKMWIEKSVAYHLGMMKRMFDSGEVCEDDVENADETNFVFNMDNGKTLGFIGDDQMKYADVVSAGEPIKMMVRISGGRGASIKPPMIIFKNNNRSYPVRGVPDTVAGY